MVFYSCASPRRAPRMPYLIYATIRVLLSFSKISGHRLPAGLPSHRPSRRLLSGACFGGTWHIGRTIFLDFMFDIVFDDPLRPRLKCKSQSLFAPACSWWKLPGVRRSLVPWCVRACITSASLAVAASSAAASRTRSGPGARVGIAKRADRGGVHHGRSSWNWRWTGSIASCCGTMFTSCPCAPCHPTSSSRVACLPSTSLC